MLAPPTTDQMKPVAKTLEGMVRYLTRLERKLERRGFMSGNAYFDRVESARRWVETLSAWTSRAASNDVGQGESMLTVWTHAPPREARTEDCLGEGI